MDVMTLTEQQIAQLKALDPGVFTAHQLRQVNLDHGLTWVLPIDFLPGCTQAYGIPVLHADVPAPLLGLDPAGPLS
jgi:hypothetical protein